MNEEELFKEIAKIEPKDRMKFLREVKILFWGEKRAELQENILERYDNEEYWERDIIEFWDKELENG